MVFRQSSVRKCILLLAAVVGSGYLFVQYQAHKRRALRLASNSNSFSLANEALSYNSSVAPYYDSVLAPAASFTPAETLNADLPQTGGLLSSLFGSACLNTKQGKDLLSDNYGSVCHRDDLTSDGCCARFIDRNSCKSCRLDLKCCETFEYCVSCCVKQRLPPGRASVSATTFEACEKDCRTSSRSTRHGNEYKHKFKHCYDSGEHNLQQLILDANDTKVTLAQPSFSCKEACGGLRPRHSCSEELMNSLNNCEVLKSHFPCEAGCKTENRADSPSYMVPSSKQDHQPGLCLVNEKASGFDCNGRHPAARRLCLCLNLDALR